MFSEEIGDIHGWIGLAVPEECGVPADPMRGSPINNTHVEHLDEAQRTLEPGAHFRARVVLHLESSPGEGRFPFNVTFGGVGVETVTPDTTTTELQRSDNTGLQAKVRFPLARTWQVQVAGETYTQMEVGGTEVAGTATGPEGAPAIPIFRRIVAVPQGAGVSLLDLDVSYGETISNVLMYPVQVEVSDDSHTGDQGSGEVGDFTDRPFVRDDSAYQRNAFVPEQPVTVLPIGRMRDLELAQVSVAAAQYNPVTRELRLVENVSFGIDFNGGSGYFLTQRAVGAFESASFDLYGGALNAGNLLQFVDPAVFPLNCVGSELLIVTHQDFRAAADDLAGWKREKGISTRVVSTDSIVDTGDSMSTQRTKIKDFIQTQYNECLVRLSYVLLIGDAEYIPAWYRTIKIGSDNEQDAGTDLDYALLDTGGAFSFDILPDVAIGRMPVDTLSQAQTVVDKTINYEKSPTGDPGFYQDASFAAYFQCCRPVDDVGFEGVTSRAYIETMELARAHMAAQGYNVERIYSTDTDRHDNPDKDSYYDGDPTPQRYRNTTLMPADLRGGFAWDGDTQDIVDSINDGRFLVVHRDHGGRNGWSSPSFRTSDLASLNNGNKLPVIFSVNCASGIWDNETAGGANGTTVSGVYWAEQALRMAGGGAVGVLGDTRNSPTWANNAITRGFFDAIWPGTIADYGDGTSFPRLGDILNYGKLYMVAQVGVSQTAGSVSFLSAYDNVVMWHALGDPTLEMWTSRPSGLLISIFDILSSDIRHLSVGYAVEGAIITALQDGVPLGRATVAKGVADMSFITEASSTKDIQLSVSILGDTSKFLGSFSAIDLGPDLRPNAMEVSQGIQNLDNEMPLVEDRRTIVRVYVENAGLIPFATDVSNVRARLYATRGGANVSGSPINAKNHPITVQADGGDRRNLDDSFWFYLPSGWRSGTVTLRAVIDYNDTVDESNEGNNEITETVTFHEAETFNLVVVPLHLHINGDPSQGTAIFWGDSRESYRWDLYNNMYRLHPISDLDVWRFTSSLKPDGHTGTEWDMTVKADRSDMLARVWWKDSKTTDWANELHYMGGVEAVMPTGGTLGSAYTSGSDRQSWVQMWNIHDGYPDWYLKGGNSMAHEMAHNEARSHVNCSGGEGDPDASYPWPNPNCNIADEDDTGWFGLDVYYSKWGMTEPTIIDNTIDGDTDLDAYPLMGYERPRWIDPWTYCALLNRYGVTCNLSIGGSSASVEETVTPPHVQPVLDADRVATVAGSLSEEGITPFGSLANIDMQNMVNVFQDTVNKWVKRQEALDLDNSPFSLEVRDAAGDLLSTQPLAAFHASEEDGPRSFFELVPWPTNARDLILRDGTLELDRRQASPNPPTVQVLEPAAGPPPNDPLRIRVRWTASDADNDPLTFNLLYSPDGGDTWRAIELGLAETEHLIDLDQTPLPGSTQGLFRVEANDGFNTSRDDADVTIDVRGSAPLVAVHSPREGAKLVSREPLILDGSAEDVEDGRLVGQALEWSSSVDGALGTGEELLLDEGALSAGRHQITLTATDSNGMKGAATVEVFVES